MNINEISTNKYTILLEETFDFESHKDFRSNLKDIMEKKPQYLGIDFSHVEYIDSSALGMLMLAKHEAEQKKCDLELINLKDGHAKSVLSLVKFDQLFTIKE